MANFIGTLFMIIASFSLGFMLGRIWEFNLWAHKMMELMN